MRLATASARVIGVASLVLLGGTVPAEDVSSFGPDSWLVASGQVEEFLGRTSLAGDADLKDTRFGDGVIEVDLAVTGERCFPGIVFRAQDDNNAETIYLRPHKPKADDALQYTPIWNGLTNWQLYSGRGYTAPVDIPTDRWVHLRLEVLGSRARVFIGEATTPALVVTRLKRGSEAGGVGLRAPIGGAAHFSDFRVSSAEGLDFGPAPMVGSLGGTIDAWQLSQAFPVAEINREHAPDARALEGAQWQAVMADETGLVDIGRHVVRGSGAPDVVLARAVVESQTDEVRRLTFGYSDEVSLFVNGTLLFRGNSAFRSRDPSFAGIVGRHDAVFPRLEKGRNEILFMVTEAMGGWGFTARLEPVRGDAVVLADALRPAWAVAEGLQRPESAAYDADQGALFVSNVNGAQPGDGFVSRLTPQGEVTHPKWATDLNRPTGLAVHEGRVLVVEREGVAVFDAATAERVAHYACSTDGFLNDVAVSPEGTLYVSDSAQSRVYRIQDGQCEEWMSGGLLDGSNGVLVDGDTLLVGNMGAGNLLFIDRETRHVELVIELEPGGVDGIQHDGRGGYLVSHYEGRIFRVQRSGQVEELVDSRAAGRYCADFGYVASKGLVVVPDLRGNGLYAYEEDLAADRRTNRDTDCDAPAVTYVANEGFLLEGGGHAVLIDALFDEGFGQYQAPTAGRLDDLVNGRSPFADVDLLLFTHAHGDHFNPELVLAHLRANARTRLVAHTQTVDHMRDLEGFDEIAGRVHELDVVPGDRERLEINGVSLDALCLDHSPYYRDGRNVHEGLPSLAFAVELEGKRVLHLGDAVLALNANRLGAFPFAKRPVDLLFLPHFDVSEASQRVVAETIRPARVGAMHLPPSQWQDESKQFERTYAGALVFPPSPDLPRHVLASASNR